MIFTKIDKVRIIPNLINFILIISKWNNIMSCFISSFNTTSPPALSQGEGDRAEGL